MLYTLYVLEPTTKVNKSVIYMLASTKWEINARGVIQSTCALHGMVVFNNELQFILI